MALGVVAVVTTLAAAAVVESLGVGQCLLQLVLSVPVVLVE